MLKLNSVHRCLLFKYKIHCSINNLNYFNDSHKVLSKWFSSSKSTTNTENHAKLPNKSKSAPSKPSIPIDHRTIGASQSLFYHNLYSPGSPFFLPHGTIIYNNLISYLRQEYYKRGYNEIRSPLLYDWRLWLKSGHWNAYRENMFLVQGGQEGEQEQEIIIDNNSTNPDSIEAEKEQELAMKTAQKLAETNIDHASCAHHTHTESLNSEIENNLSSGYKGHETGKALYGLKPMNCPGHCLVFKSRKRSYRELPLRYADFSDLHRNEISGSLTGLTRVRRFAQDDAHIFCTLDQVETEIKQCLNFVQTTYAMFNFQFQLKLSTRPKDYIGDLTVWNQAENSLKQMLINSGMQYELNEGDGAFYGPKIDISVLDYNNKSHQCATVQLDFNLPARFQLKYTNSDGQNIQPVLIHRAILGSLERMIAILTEHFQGKWPLWLSPRQIRIITIASEKERRHIETAENLKSSLKTQLDKENYSQNLYIDIDSEVLSISKKVRTAQLLGYNYIIVIGDSEVNNPNQLTIRIRDQTTTLSIPITQFITHLQQEIQSKSIKSMLVQSTSVSNSVS